MTEDEKRDNVTRVVADFVGHLATVTGGQVLVVVWPEALAEPLSGGWGNLTGLAGMMRRACEDTVTLQERPTDCVKCAASWDLIKTAALALTGARGNC